MFVQAGMSRVKSNLMGQVKRGKMSQQQVDKLLSKLKGTLSYDDFKSVDMVVEAVIESIDLKQKIFAGVLSAACYPECHAHPDMCRSVRSNVCSTSMCR